MSSVNAMLLIHDFHTKFGLEYVGGPRKLTGNMLDLRVKRLAEEGQELLDAKTVAEQADALIDIMYIAIGTKYLTGMHLTCLINNHVYTGSTKYTEEASIKALTRMCIDGEPLQPNHPGLVSPVTYLDEVIYLCGRICFYLGYPALSLLMEVHNANMRKERGSEKTSKYGNGFDIVKPEGWVGPDIDTVLTIYGFNPKKEVSL